MDNGQRSEVGGKQWQEKQRKGPEARDQGQRSGVGS